MEKITYLETPRLHEPILIAGFEGWPNAAEVSSYAVQYLVDHLKAKEFAAIPIESFYQLSTLRPTATIKGGKVLELKYPTNHFYYSEGGGLHDIILFRGTEPHVHWTRFVSLLLGLAERFNVCQVITLGGTYDYIPHSHPPVVSALFNHEDLREKVIQCGLQLTEYSGPISIHTYILEEARRMGLKAISLWGHAPQYLQAKNIKVICSVLQRLITLTETEIDLSELERASEYFDQQVNHLVEQDPKLQEIVKKLEEIYKQSASHPSLMKKEEESKEDKVVYIQAFLKRQEDEEKRED
jgi:proteasome assembly chaperone (PAC2) family protein